MTAWSVGVVSGTMGWRMAWRGACGAGGETLVPQEVVVPCWWRGR